MLSVTDGYTLQRLVTRSFDVFFDFRLKKNGWVNSCEAGVLDAITSIITSL